MDREKEGTEAEDKRVSVAETDKQMHEGAAPLEDDIWMEEEDDEDAPPPRRKWIRNAVLVFLAAALVGNILAFWPRIYNRETLPFLFKSGEISSREDIQGYKEAIVQIGSDKGKGTGFHISNGYIVTNYHVIVDNAFTVVQFPDRSPGYEAELEAADPELDIAILKVDLGGEELPYIEIERERPWEAGDSVFVIGNPLYFSQIAGEGKLIGLVPIRNRPKPALAIDAQIFKGHSGSPVINERGNVVAVVYATTELDREGGRMKAGLAVPVDDMDDLLRRMPLNQD